MEEILDKNKKKREKLYAYNINKKKTLRSNNIQFKNLEKNFYEEIIDRDINLIDKKKDLNNMKTNIIKEYVYTNKPVPNSWKNKFSYNEDLTKAMNTDKEFFKYINEKKTDEDSINLDFENEHLKTAQNSILDNLTQTQTNITFSSNDNNNNKEKSGILDVINFIKNDIVAPTMNETNNSNINNNSSKDINKKDRTISFKKTTNLLKHVSMFREGILNDKLIQSKLEEYRTMYDMNEFIEDIKKKRLKEGKDLELNTGGISNLMKERNNNYRRFLRERMQNKKAKVLRDSIYVNLLPPKDKLEQIDIEQNKKRKFQIKNPFKIPLYLKSDSPEFDHPPEITNPKIKRDLELINYYGPKYVYCKYCNYRNLKYYQLMEEKQTLKLLKYLKKIRIGSEEDSEDENNKKNNNK